MEAMILAGGLGNRLGKIVKNTPKPLLLVNGRPFIQKIVERLIDQGVNHIIFCLSYKAQKIRNFFGDGSMWGIRFSYVIEDKPMGTAGAIAGAFKKINGLNIIILNGDSFCYFDIQNLSKQHRLKNADATLSVLKVDKPQEYGLVLFDKEMRVNKFIEKSKISENKLNYINAGVYILKTTLIKKISNCKPMSLEKEFFPKILHKNIQAFILKSNKFIDIGTPISYKYSDAFFNGEDEIYRK